MTILPLTPAFDAKDRKRKILLKLDLNNNEYKVMLTDYNVSNLKALFNDTFIHHANCVTPENVRVLMELLDREDGINKDSPISTASEKKLKSLVIILDTDDKDRIEIIKAIQPR